MNSLQFCYVIRSAVNKMKSTHLSGAIRTHSFFITWPFPPHNPQDDNATGMPVLGWKSHQTACLVQTAGRKFCFLMSNWTENEVNNPLYLLGFTNPTKFSIPIPSTFSHNGIFDGRGWSRRRCIMLQAWLPALRTFDISHWPDECLWRKIVLVSQILWVFIDKSLYLFKNDFV